MKLGHCTYHFRHAICRVISCNLSHCNIASELVMFVQDKIFHAICHVNDEPIIRTLGTKILWIEKVFNARSISIWYAKYIPHHYHIQYVCHIHSKDLDCNNRLPLQLQDLLQVQPKSLQYKFNSISLLAENHFNLLTKSKEQHFEWNIKPNWSFFKNSILIKISSQTAYRQRFLIVLRRLQMNS